MSLRRKKPLVIEDNEKKLVRRRKNKRTGFWKMVIDDEFSFWYIMDDRGEMKREYNR